MFLASIKPGEDMAHVRVYSCTLRTRRLVRDVRLAPMPNAEEIEQLRRDHTAFIAQLGEGESA